MNRGFERDDLMAILEGVEDAVVKLDGRAHFVAMNQAAATIHRRLGLDPQMMKAKSIWEVFPDLKGTLVERELKISVGTKRRDIPDHQGPFWCFGTSHSCE